MPSEPLVAEAVRVELAPRKIVPEIGLKFLRVIFPSVAVRVPFSRTSNGPSNTVTEIDPALVDKLARLSD